MRALGLAAIQAVTLSPMFRRSSAFVTEKTFTRLIGASIDVPGACNGARTGRSHAFSVPRRILLWPRPVALHDLPRPVPVTLSCHSPPCPSCRGQSTGGSVERTLTLGHGLIDEPRRAAVYTPSKPKYARAFLKQTSSTRR